MAKYQLRESALELLTRIGEEGGYSHVLLDQEISKRQLSSKDGALLTEIVYGTLQNKLKIDYQIHSYLAKQKKLKPWVKWLLYMSVYQMLYLERVPDHAVIHEAVEISKIKGHKGISNLVNGVLRNIQRNGVRSTEQISDPIEQLSIETSHPKWLVERWVDQYGIEITKGICYQNLKHLPMSVRVQPIRITRDTAIEELKSRGIQTEISRFSSQGLLITEGNILNDPLFKEGFISVQDQSSMLVAEMMDLSPELAVLDACSAPGGKQLILQKKIYDKGEVVAYDLHKKKANLVNEKAILLQLNSIQAAQADSRNLGDIHERESFDRILLDAPCSGLGVLRGKPDIKYHKQEQDIFNLRRIQDSLLTSVAPLLKKGGKMVYSTCTIDRHENEEAIKQFLNQNDNFAVDPSFYDELPGFLQNGRGMSEYGLQIFPQQWDTDGFFLPD